MNYTVDGQRVSKVKSYYGGSTSHYYTYNGSTLVQEKIVTSGSQTTEYLTFLYNSEGPTGFVYNNTLYTYRKNIFGDIIAIYQGNTKVAEYAYDAYGNCTIVFATGNAGILNPFRYRGYYFDEDMKLYYLQSRYYDPETGRFINADDVSYLDPETIHGLNLYAYCLNNPVMYADPTGELAITSFLIGLGIAAGVAAGIGAASYVVTEVISWALTGEWTWSWDMFVGSILGGAIGGALSYIFPVLGIAGSALINGFVSNAIGMGLQNEWEGTTHSAGDIFIQSLMVGGLSALTAGITSKIKIKALTGRGSISQVTRQIYTKFHNGTIKRVTAKALGKTVIYEATYSIFNTLVNILINVVKHYSKHPYWGT